MKITYNGNDSSGLNHYSRVFINKMTDLYPFLSYVKYQGEMKDSNIFHSFNSTIPEKVIKSSAKKIITITHDDLNQKKTWWKSIFSKTTIKNSIDKVDVIITPSKNVKKELINLYQTNQNKIKVIPPYCDFQFNPNFSEDLIFSLQHKFNIPKRFILFVGKINKESNLISLGNALQGTDIPLVIVGQKTNYLKKVKKMMRVSNVHNTTIDINEISQEYLEILYHLTDLFVYPFTNNGADGLPIIRALVAKKQVLTSNNGLEKYAGEHSFFINPNLIEDIKAKIIFLWNNPAERERRIEKSTIHLAQFHIEQIAKQIMDVYKFLK